MFERMVLLRPRSKAFQGRRRVGKSRPLCDAFCEPIARAFGDVKAETTRELHGRFFQNLLVTLVGIAFDPPSS